MFIFASFGSIFSKTVWNTLLIDTPVLSSI